MAQNYDVLFVSRGFYKGAKFIISVIYESLYESKQLEEGYINEDLYFVAKDILKFYDKRDVEDLKNRIETFSKNEKVELMLSIYSLDTRYGFTDVTSSRLISDLSIELLKLMGGDMLIDFGCGTGAFLSRAYEYSLEKDFIFKDLLGLDVNINCVNITKMILSALKNNEVNPFIESQSILDEYKYPFNKSFSFPPFGVKKAYEDFSYKSKVVDFTFTNKNSFELSFIEKMVQSIRYNERAVAIMPARVLFNSIDREYINQLITKGLVEGIIELPQNSVEAISIRLYAIIFSSNNKEVKLLDATEIVGNDSYKITNTCEIVSEIINVYNSKKCMTKLNEELTQIKNICPSNILTDSKIRKDGYKLEDVADVFLGCQYTVKNFKDSFVDYKSNYKILTSKDIEDGSVNWNSLQNIEYKDTKFNKYAVQKNDVVVTSKSSKVKTVVVDIEPKENILVTGGMIIVRPNTELLDPTFLKIFLDSSEGQLALHHIQKGATIISINAKDLAGIIVPKVKIEKQREIAKKYNDKLSTLIAYKREIAKLEKKLEDLYFEEMEVI